VPNEHEGKEKLDRATRGMAALTPFAVPQLKVGTVDKLMALSDKLSKVDTMVEGIVKKIERSLIEFIKGDAGMEQEDVKLGASPDLMIDKKTPSQYVESFEWNKTRYPTKRDLSSITDSILEQVHLVDDDLKKTIAKYTEIRQNLGAIERRETGSLLVKPLGQFLSGANAKLVIEKEWLTTLVIVVPKVKEKEFLAEYELLEDMHAEREEKERQRREQEREARAKKQSQAGQVPVADAKDDDKDKSKIKDKDDKEKDKAKEDKEKPHGKDEKEKVSSPKPGAPAAAGGGGAPAAAPAGGAAERAAERERERDRKDKEERSSEKDEKKDLVRNIVPRSAMRITPENYEDEFSLWRVLVLKKGVELIKTLMREKRYTVRPAKFDPLEEKASVEEKTKLTAERKKLWVRLIGFCRTNYSEVFVSWIHIKVMRIFCEAILRFGLPPNFNATLIEPKKGREPRLRQILKELYSHLPNAAYTDAVEGEQDLSGMGADFYPYVYVALNVSGL